MVMGFTLVKNLGLYRGFWMCDNGVWKKESWKVKGFEKRVE